MEYKEWLKERLYLKHIDAQSEFDNLLKNHPHYEKRYQKELCMKSISFDIDQLYKFRGWNPKLLINILNKCELDELLELQIVFDYCVNSIEQ